MSLLRDRFNEMQILFMECARTVAMKEPLDARYPIEWWRDRVRDLLWMLDRLDAEPEPPGEEPLA